MVHNVHRPNRMSYPIHQIWIGPASPPTFWMDTVKAFARTHNYPYMLWTETEVAKLNVRNPDLLQELLTRQHWAGASDVIRLEVLAQYGGIYIDADTVVMKPQQFHIFIQARVSQTFFGCEYDDCHLIANGTIGTPKQSAFIQDALSALGKFALEKKDEPDYKRVGPYFLTDFIKRRAQRDYELIPRAVFYPRSWHGINDPWLHTKVTLPDESLLWQYGYSTNNFKHIFAIRNIIALLLVIALLYLVRLLLPAASTSIQYSGLGAILVGSVLTKLYFIH